MNTHVEAVTYLQLANELIRQVNPKAITIAEDMSGMPGMCLPIEDGGIGFDYRLAMGMPDMWIRTVKERRDEEWNISGMWGDFCLRRPGEGTVAYVESHDQALVGDQTMIFRLAGASMYTDMSKDCHNMVIDRAIALHKMIRLFSIGAGGEAYLNFMGNEFGHPEWIDFPREGNGWSYHYCRRQWSLADNESLRYGELNEFDRAMIALLKSEQMLSEPAVNRWMHQEDKVLVYTKGELVFVFNLHPSRSFDGYFVPVGEAGRYKVVLSTDEERFGGFGRVDRQCRYQAKPTADGWIGFPFYLPCRTATVLKKVSGRGR